MELPIEFRPHPIELASRFLVWALICILAFSGIQFVFPAFPIWAFVILSLLISVPLGIPNIFAYARFTTVGIESRSVFARSCTWQAVSAWTQWGDIGSTFIRLESGKVFTFENRCIFGSQRNRLLHQILTTYAGPETKGSNAVLPPMLRAFLGDSLLGRDIGEF
jgi:hypothetical protein